MTYTSTMAASDKHSWVIARAAALDTDQDGCLDSHHPRTDACWREGYAAFKDRLLLEDCPFEPGDEADDWLRGWMAAELIEFGRIEDSNESA